MLVVLLVREDFFVDDGRDPVVQHNSESNHEHEWNLFEKIRRPLAKP